MISEKNLAEDARHKCKMHRCKIVWKEEITTTQVTCFSLILGLRNVQSCVTCSVASTPVLKRIFTVSPLSSPETLTSCRKTT